VKSLGATGDLKTQVLASTDIVELIGQSVALKRRGKSFVGLCPFHQEKTPSFGVNPTMAIFHCFGCQKSGDAITWVRETEHLDFVGSVELLAGWAGITLRYSDKDEGESRKRRAPIGVTVRLRAPYRHAFRGPSRCNGSRISKCRNVVASRTRKSVG